MFATWGHLVLVYVGSAAGVPFVGFYLLPLCVLSFVPIDLGCSWWYDGKRNMNAIVRPDSSLFSRIGQFKHLEEITIFRTVRDSCHRNFIHTLRELRTHALLSASCRNLYVRNAVLRICDIPSTSCVAYLVLHIKFPGKLSTNLTIEHSINLPIEIHIRYFI